MMRKGDLVFAVGGDPGNACDSRPLRKILAFMSSRPKATKVAIATGNGDEVCIAGAQGVIRQQIEPGLYRLYSYRGDTYDNLRRTAVLLAQGHAQGWIGEADLADESCRRLVLSVFGEAVLRNEDRASLVALSHHDRLPKRNERCVSERRVSGMNGPALVIGCYAGAAEAFGLLDPVFPRDLVLRTAAELERKLLRDPRWHARNQGEPIEIVQPLGPAAA
jgi:hypothetical protein